MSEEATESSTMDAWVVCMDESLRMLHVGRGRDLVMHMAEPAPHEQAAGHPHDNVQSGGSAWIFFLADGRALAPIEKPDYFKPNPKGDIEPEELDGRIRMMLARADELGWRLPETDPDSFNNPNCHVVIPKPQTTLRATIDSLGEAFGIFSDHEPWRGSDLHNWWHRQLNVPFSQPLPWES